MQTGAGNITLDFPTLSTFPSYVEALRKGFYVGIGAVKTLDEIRAIEDNPQAHILEKNGPAEGVITTPSGHVFNKVPYETLWLCDGDIFIGEVSFRLELNQLLHDFGGHVGYGIRPDMAGQGYGTLALALTCQRAAKYNIDRRLVTCSPGNPASERIIVKNGGVLEDIRDNSHYGFGLSKRYWMQIS